MNYSLSIIINSADGDYQFSCKVDLKPWHFWSRKGYKSFDVEGSSVDVYWDLRSAKFTNGPEPAADYYVAHVSDDEVVLLLRDYKKKAYKRTKSRPALVEHLLYYKKENVFSKKSFATRARFDERRKEHEIIVESPTTGMKDPEMLISVDGVVLIHVRICSGNSEEIRRFWSINSRCRCFGTFMTGRLPPPEPAMGCLYSSRSPPRQKVTGRVVRTAEIVIPARILQVLFYKNPHHDIGILSVSSWK